MKAMGWILAAAYGALDGVLSFLWEYKYILLMIFVLIVWGAFKHQKEHHEQKKQEGEVIKKKNLPKRLTLLARDTSQLLGEKIENIQRAVFTISLYGGAHGSGFFVSKEGWAITNRHVVEDDENFDVQLTNNKDQTVQAIAKRIAMYDELDIAFIAVNFKPKTPLRISTEEVKIGDEVYAVGTPLDEDFQGTVTRGIVSSFREHEELGKVIQSDAVIHPGNSGGPLLDKHGNVIGVAVAVIEDAKSINFFIPITEVLKKIKHGFTAS